MDSARPSDPKNLLTLQEAAERLAVSVDILLQWNELHILKPTITHEGKIGYTEEQLQQFLQIRQSVKTNISKFDISPKIAQGEPGRASHSGEASSPPPR